MFARLKSAQQGHMRPIDSTALQRFFAHYYAGRPVQATFTGVHDHDARLPDWSPHGLDGHVAEMRGLRRALAAEGRVDDQAVRCFPDEVDRALADGFLAIQIAEHESGHFLHQNPALWTGEAIFGVIALVTREFAPLDTRLESTVARMRVIPPFFDNARRVLRAVPEEWRPRALREAAAGAQLFGESLPRWWTRLRNDRLVSDDLAVKLDAAGRDAARAFARFAEWMGAELPAASADRTQCGSTLLALLLRRGHWCLRSIDELLEEARTSFAEAVDELERRARQAASGWQEVQQQLAAAHPALDDYVARFERVWRACREMAIAHDLVTWPDAPIRYVPIPEHTRDVAPQLYYLFYRSPAPFDRVDVHDYVVTPITRDLPVDEQQRRLRAANDSVITLNHVVHHGALGHHVQNAHAAHSASRIGQVAAVDGASRIGMFCGGTLAEGWACYACDLAEDMGFLTPLEAVAQQHTRVRLLARAVADLELHTSRRTLDEVVSLYRDHARMTPEAAQIEAVKNSMFPGAAVMYWLGTRDLHALRRRIEGQDGAAFTLRRFHDRVLSYGSIPVPLIARLMDGHTS